MDSVDTVAQTNGHVASPKHHEAPPMSKHYPPAAELDWERLGVQAQKVYGHIECTWTAATGEWSEPVFSTEPTVKVDALAPGLNYGQQAYEGLKAVRDATGVIRVFRIDRHAHRFAHSCRTVSLPEVPTPIFIECVRRAVANNATFVPPIGSPACLYIRPLAFGSSGTLNVQPAAEAKFCVMVSPINALHGLAAIDAVVLEDFDRAAPRGIGHAKVGGNYAPMFQWSQQTKKQGFGITLHLDSQTRSYVDEFGTCGFIAVRKNQGGGFHLVIPTSASAIGSVTSSSCVEIAKRKGWTVVQRPIPFTELPTFDEIIAVGTASILLPIRSITRFSTNDKFHFQETVGSAAALLLQELHGAFRGENGWEDWTTAITM